MFTIPKQLKLPRTSLITRKPVISSTDTSVVPLIFPSSAEFEDFKPKFDEFSRTTTADCKLELQQCLRGQLFCFLNDRNLMSYASVSQFIFQWFLNGKK
jgi:hypothetical protein